MRNPRVTSILGTRAIRTFSCRLAYGVDGGASREVHSSGRRLSGQNAGDCREFFRERGKFCSSRSIIVPCPMIEVAIAHGVVRKTERERRMVDLTSASWNRLTSWLRQIAALKQAA